MTDTTPISSAPSSTGISSAGGILGEQADSQTFLLLLVTQMKNQDPLNPQDPTQFVSQLAQFSSLEQLLGMRQSLETLVSSLTPPESDSSGS